MKGVIAFSWQRAHLENGDACERKPFPHSLIFLPPLDPLTIVSNRRPSSPRLDSLYSTPDAGGPVLRPKKPRANGSRDSLLYVAKTLTSYNICVAVCVCLRVCVCVGVCVCVDRSRIGFACLRGTGRLL